MIDTCWLIKFADPHFGFKHTSDKYINLLNVERTPPDYIYCDRNFVFGDNILNYQLWVDTWGGLGHKAGFSVGAAIGFITVDPEFWPATFDVLYGGYQAKVRDLLEKAVAEAWYKEPGTHHEKITEQLNIDEKLIEETITGLKLNGFRFIFKSFSPGTLTLTSDNNGYD